MPGILTFIGWHNSGKTTLIAKVIKTLTQKGWKVFAIKSSSHRGIDFDTPQSDTRRLRASGSEAVALIAPDQQVFIRPNDNLPLRALAQRYFPLADLVLCEGFKHAPDVDKIEVAIQRPPSLYKEVTGVVAVITHEELTGIRVFHPDEDQKLISFIEDHYICKKHAQPSVHLLVDGRPLSLDSVLENAILEAFSGIVNSLKNGADAGTIEILARFPKKSSKAH